MRINARHRGERDQRVTATIVAIATEHNIKSAILSGIVLTN
jgi:hypothetical protein